MAKRRAASPGQGSLLAKRGSTKAVNAAPDTANTESQDMLAMGSLLGTASTDDNEMEQFRTKVTADRKKLKALLYQHSQQAEDAAARRRSEIASTIFNALRASDGNAQRSTTAFTGTRIATNSAFAPVSEVLTASEALLEEYARLDKQITDMRNAQAEPMGEAWHQELQEAERQLHLGARVALRNVKKVLGAEIENDGKDEDLTSENGLQEAEGDDQKLNYELQKSLRYAERGVKRMVKGLPEEDST